MLNRRDVIKMAAALAAAFGIDSLPAPVVAALKAIDPATVPKIIYLQGLSCSGCSVSLLQATQPAVLTMLTEYSRLAFHGDLAAASGALAQETINHYIEGKAGEYFLVLEGAIPAAMPEACQIGEHTLADYLVKASTTMNGALAVGSCACYGGIPAAEGNLTGAVGLREFFKSSKIDKLVIDIPGCSVHPDWVWHTIVHLVRSGLPELIKDRPAQFYSKKVHELCSRYHDFQEEIFAGKLGDSGCLFKLGCLGPDSYADCPTRGWNGTSTFCVEANAPCVGCTSPDFARKKTFPFYRLNENTRKKKT
ncbi:MAG: hydrogenase [Deltaproteobacteria bacterium RIFOXYD12_FULL_57_12]|nr:MAG: hydrogenase [Deltaproteobacteria bacterium RIFOXYD12_FULL_57_12]